MTRKNLFLMVSLTLLVFAGQVSAQIPSVSFKHVPGAGGTENVVSGKAGMEVVVELSITGIPLPPLNSYSFSPVFDGELLELTSAVNGNGYDLTGLFNFGGNLIWVNVSGADPVVPPAVLATITFTTKKDIAAGETFSIGIDPASIVASGLPDAILAIVKAGVPGAIMFNTETVDPTPPDPTPPEPPPVDPMPPVESPLLHLDTQIESPAQNNSVPIFTDKRPGDTLQIQLFVPDAAGQDIQAFTLELALQGKTFANFIRSISGSDWMGGSLFSGLSASDNPTLSGLFLNAATVPGTGYLGQIDLEVIGVLTDEDMLRVTSAFLAVADEGLQSLDVSNAALSFTPASICPGDFDDNGIVNMADFVLFEGVFGTRSSDVGYNALMDMDSNGTIDVADFLLFVDVFDTTCEQQPPPPPPTVHIQDANLRAVIEDSLSKASGAPITPSEMASLTRLEAPNSNISDLTGLEFATGLTVLDLGYEVVDNTIVNSNSISDITPLSGLTNLTRLSLSSNSISDIPSLSSLTNLTWLDLAYNSILDITPLSGLTRLAWLELSGNRISDITPLSGLIGLTNLYLRFNSISDISSLSSLTNLTVLWLRENKISDIAPLVANTGLGSGDRVDVRSNPLSATSRNTHIPALRTRGVDVRL